MLPQGRFMAIIRKRSATHKSYLPKNTRENQYLLAEFKITDQLITQFAENSNAQSPYFEFYQKLSTEFFQTATSFEVENCQFIANDKLARVRFSHEMHQWQTNQQILFYYNPASHKLQKAFFDSNKRAKKITLLFLASGDDIRVNAASFHARITHLLTLFCQTINLSKNEIRLRDHQHLTYDLFTREKGKCGSVALKLRPLIKRYANQEVNLPIDNSAITYAVVNIPVTNSVINLVDIDIEAKDPYNPLYTLITDNFSKATKTYNLNNGALIANGLIPIVRHSLHDSISSIGEIQMLGYNPQQTTCGVISKWDAANLVDNIQLIFVAAKESLEESGFSQFLNQIEQASKLLAKGLAIDEKRDEVIVRFHQHIAYNL